MSREDNGRSCLGLIQIPVKNGMGVAGNWRVSNSQVPGIRVEMLKATRRGEDGR